MANSIISLYESFIKTKGYDTPVLKFFANWEIVKDEILKPVRKTGKGNGTIHIFLGGNNYAEIKKLFPVYISKFESDIATDADCPKIKHFVKVSNLSSVCGQTYLWLKKENKLEEDGFDIVAYLDRLSKYKETDILEFESLLKISTGNRPYFKQFTGNVFNELVRELFVPDYSTYQAMLYRDKDGGYGCFWLIGNTFLEEELIDMTSNPAISSKIQSTPSIPLKVPRNLIIYGAPGTGKSYELREKAKKNGFTDED